MPSGPAAKRRSDALFTALSGDFLLREQFVTDPAQVLTEYVDGSSLAPEAADAANQFVYASLSNPYLVRWVQEYAARYRGDPPARDQFANDLARAVAESGDKEVVLALVLGASADANLFEAQSGLMRSLIVALGRARGGGVFAGTEMSPGGTEMSPGTGGTEMSPGQLVGRLGAGVFAGTEMSPGTGGTEMSPGTGGTEMSPGTGGTEMSPGQLVGRLGAGVFAGTEMSPGTGGTEMSPGTGGTEMSPGTGGTEMSPGQLVGRLGAGVFAGTEMSPGTGGTEMSPGTGGTEMSPGGFVGRVGGRVDVQVTFNALVEFAREVRASGALGSGGLR